MVVVLVLDWSLPLSLSYPGQKEPYCELSRDFSPHTCTLEPAQNFKPRHHKCLGGPTQTRRSLDVFERAVLGFFAYDNTRSECVPIKQSSSRHRTVPEAVARYTNPIAIGYTNFRIL